MYSYFNCYFFSVCVNAGGVNSMCLKRIPAVPTIAELLGIFTATLEKLSSISAPSNTKFSRQDLFKFPLIFFLLAI